MAGFRVLRELTAWSNGCLRACSPSLKVSGPQSYRFPLNSEEPKSERLEPGRLTGPGSRFLRTPSKENSNSPRRTGLPDFAALIAINVDDGAEETSRNSLIILDTQIPIPSIAVASLNKTERYGQEKAFSVGENLKLIQATCVRFVRSGTGLKWNDS